MRIQQFSLRDLALLVVLCAVGFGWYRDRERLTKLARPAPSPAPAVGRFQLLQQGEDTVAIDTATGRMWHWYPALSQWARKHTKEGNVNGWIGPYVDTLIDQPTKREKAKVSVD